MTYHPTTTALLLVDPYNDFLSEGGKLWPRVKAIAEEVRLLDHLRALVRLARKGNQDLHCAPPPLGTGGLREWDHPTPYQLGGAKRQTSPRELGVAPSTTTSAAAGGHRRARALGIERVRQHRSRPAAEAVRHQPRDPRRHDRQHLHRGDRPIRHGTRLPRHPGEGRDRRLQPGGHARRARDQRADLRPRHHHHRRSHRRAQGEWNREDRETPRRTGPLQGT